MRSRIERAANSSLFFYAVSTVTLPVCIVMMNRELGFSLTEAGALGFFASLAQIVFLLLSGILAARIGKIPILKFSIIVMGAGMILFSRTISYPMAVGLVLLMGVGKAFLEALLTPLIEDLYPEDDGSRQNMLHSFWPAGVLFSTVIIGELLSRGISWRWVFAVIGVITLFIYFVFPRAKRVELPRSRSDFSHVMEIFSQPKFYILAFCLFFAGGAEGGFTYWLASYIQLNLGGLPRAGGIGTALFALGMFVGRYATSKVAAKFPLKRIIQVSALLAILFDVFFFFSTAMWAVYLSAFLAGLTIACFWPSLQTYAVRALPLDPTMIMILLSCFGLVGFSSASLLMGIIGDRWDLHTGFIVVPVFQVLLVMLLVVETKVHLRRSADATD